MGRQNDDLAVVPWYWRDWRASKARAKMTPLARGIYRELLDAHYGETDFALPDDDRELALLAGVDPKTWRKVRDEILPWLPVNDDGRRQNPRAVYEWRVARKNRARVRKLQQKAAKARWDKEKAVRAEASRRNAGALPPQCPVVNDASPSLCPTTPSATASPSPTPTTSATASASAIQTPPPTSSGDLDAAGVIIDSGRAPTAEEEPVKCPSCSRVRTVVRESRVHGNGRPRPRPGFWCATGKGGCGTAFELGDERILVQLPEAQRRAIEAELRERRGPTEPTRPKVQAPPENDPEAVARWSLVKIRIKTDIGDVRFTDWFLPTEGLDFESGALRVVVPGPVHREQLRKNYRDVVIAAMDAAGLPPEMGVVFVEEDVLEREQTITADDRNER